MEHWAEWWQATLYNTQAKDPTLALKINTNARGPGCCELQIDEPQAKSVLAHGAINSSDGSREGSLREELELDFLIPVRGFVFFTEA